MIIFLFHSLFHWFVAVSFPHWCEHSFLESLGYLCWLRLPNCDKLRDIWRYSLKVTCSRISDRMFLWQSKKDWSLALGSSWWYLSFFPGWKRIFSCVKLFRYLIKLLPFLTCWIQCAHDCWPRLLGLILPWSLSRHIQPHRLLCNIAADSAGPLRSKTAAQKLIYPGLLQTQLIYILVLSLILQDIKVLGLNLIVHSHLSHSQFQYIHSHISTARLLSDVLFE